MVKTKVLYHITNSERAKNILKVGFNDNLAFSNESNDLIRASLCPERFIFKWARILCSENDWPKIAVLQVLFPVSEYKKLCKRGDKMRKFGDALVWDPKEPYLRDMGDEVVLQFKKGDKVTIDVKLFWKVELDREMLLKLRDW